MEKIFIENLNNEDLMKVLDTNKKLYNILEDKYIELEMNYVSDVLDVMELEDWSIGFYNNNYCKLDRSIDGLNNLIDTHNLFGLFNENEFSLICKTKELQNRLEEMDYLNKQFKNLEMKIDLLFDEIEDIVLKYFNMITDYTFITKDVLIEMIYGDEYNSYYIIKENNDFVVYKDVVECYK